MKKANKNFSLRQNPQFFKYSKKRSNQFFSLFFLKIPGVNSKVIVIVSKKNIPLASNRNKLKRQFKAAFMNVIGSEENYVGVFRLKASVMELDFKSIENMVSQAFL